MKTPKKDPEQQLSDANPTCGIVMPISTIDNCNESHWNDVQEILSDAIESAGFTPNLVSNADDVGIIQKRIIQNLYDNPIVVCDVSGKNPNVMFELGMRLAFDKPTIIVKDDKTSYSFDTASIEHLEYPRDLRFAKIVDFKEALIAKISATHKKAHNDKTYTTFLKHFGTFTVAKIDTQEVSKEDYILEEIRNLRQYMFAMATSARTNTEPRPERRVYVLCVHESSKEEIQQIIKAVMDCTEAANPQIYVLKDNHFHVAFDPLPPRGVVLDVARKFNATSRWMPLNGPIRGTPLSA